MSLQYRNAFISLFTALLLSACGFTPMYGAKTQAALSKGVRIVAPNNAVGQKFQQELEDKLNPAGVPAKPEYELAVELRNNSTAIGVARDGTISRYNIIINSSYRLIRLSDNVVVQRDEVQHVASFNNQPNQYFSTYVSEKDAINRGVEELAELYRQRIGLVLLKGPTEAPTKVATTVEEMEKERKEQQERERSRFGFVR